MAVDYKAKDEKSDHRLSSPVTKRPGGLVLCHFSNAQDLLFGIDALRSFHIPIYEVYSPTHTDQLNARLEIRKFKRGHAVLKYGCILGLTISSIGFYIFNRQWTIPLTAMDYLRLALPIVLLIVASTLASSFITSKPPEVIKLSSADARFLIIIKTENIIPCEDVASFLQYSGSLEITRAVKRMLL
jgi:hypothetical protein